MPHRKNKKTFKVSKIMALAALFLMGSNDNSFVKAD
jgi:hypothetical protein